MRVSNRTGVTDAEVISIEIAKHLRMREGMRYAARDNPHREWRNHLAFKTLRFHPKFSNSDGNSNGVTSTYHSDPAAPSSGISADGDD